MIGLNHAEVTLGITGIGQKLHPRPLNRHVDLQYSTRTRVIPCPCGDGLGEASIKAQSSLILLKCNGI